MFDGLRKKLTDAIKGFAKREEKKEEAPESREPASPAAPEDTPRIPEVRAEKSEVEETHAGRLINPAGAEQKVEKPRLEKPRPEGPKIDLRLSTKIKGVFFSKVTLSGGEIDKFAESLKEPMLRSDVSYSTAEELLKDIRTQLGNRQISSGRIDEEITDVVRDALMQVLEGSGARIGLREMVERRISEGAVPVKILFLGPNGAGKTTTIAKIAHSFKLRGTSSVLAAADTFRAAAIEQLEFHAKNIGVPVIKTKYGADPASVAFDAIAHAKANGIQLVLIDSAGRQETNRSLISEIEKMVRVCKPDITIFVGESTAGNVIAEQIGEFGKHVHIDGIILTKLDCDAKGGNALSIAKVTGVPVLYFGTGEGYDALMPYSSEFVVNAILPAS